MVGPAHDDYMKSDLRKLIDKCINTCREGKISNGTPSHALWLAVEGGDYWQCSRCKKLLAPRAAEKHRGLVECRRIPMRFAKWRNNYFCPIGCEVFTYRAHLMRHLVSHGSSRLARWGFSKRVLKEQLRILEDSSEEQPDTARQEDLDRELGQKRQYSTLS